MGSARLGSSLCSRDKMSGLMRPGAVLKCCQDFARDLSQRSGGVLVFNHYFQFSLTVTLMTSLMVSVVVGSIIAAPQISRLSSKNRRFVQQLVGAVLVCLPLLIGPFQAPVYDKPKVSIGSILHRTLTLSSALTIELAVPVGWACLLPRMPTCLSRSDSGLIFAYLFHQQALIAVRPFAVRAIKWASAKAPGTLPILVETLILLCVLLLLTTVVPAFFNSLLEIGSFYYARWRGHRRSDVPTRFLRLWTAPVDETTRSRRSREARCLSMTMLLYILGAFMPVFMLALLPGKDFQMLEILAGQSDPLLPAYLPPHARRHTAPIVRQSLNRLAGECKWDQQAEASRWNDTQLTPPVIRAVYNAARSPGVCGITQANENDCRAGAKGTLGVAVAAFTSQAVQLKQLSQSEQKWVALSECVAQCNMCDQCRFISFSHTFKDCSWFSKCNMAALRKVPGRFVTIPVMDAIPMALSSAGAKGLAALRCAHNDTRQSCNYLATSLQNAVQSHLSNASRFPRRRIARDKQKLSTEPIQATSKRVKSGGRPTKRKASSSVVRKVRCVPPPACLPVASLLAC